MPWGILLMLLSQLLKWLLKLIEKDKSPSRRDMVQLEKVVWYVNQIKPKAVKVGASSFGIRPDEDE